jgi:hypothetical protein
MIRVGLVGSRRIWPAHVGRVVGPDGSRRIQKDRLDDHRDDQVASDKESDDTSIDASSTAHSPSRPVPVLAVSVHDRASGATTVESWALAGRQGLCHAAAMASLRVGTWNIAGARREQTNQVNLDAVVAGVRALGVELLAVQEVDRELARSGRSDQPAMIAQALGAGWFWSFAPALVGDDFRPLSGPDPGGPAYGNLLVSRLPLAAVEHLRFPPAGGGNLRLP